MSKKFTRLEGLLYLFVFTLAGTAALLSIIKENPYTLAFGLAMLLLYGWVIYK